MRMPSTRYYHQPVTPTGEPGTCLVCGSKLRPLYLWGVNYITRHEAGPEHRANWPMVKHEHRIGHEITTTYEPAHTHKWVDERVGTGLCSYTGSTFRGTLQGDNLFCSDRCAVGFARIAANMGMRLPTVTKKERLALRRHHKMVVQMCPDEISFPVAYKGKG